MSSGRSSQIRNAFTKMTSNSRKTYWAVALPRPEHFEHWNRPAQPAKTAVLAVWKRCERTERCVQMQPQKQCFKSPSKPLYPRIPLVTKIHMHAFLKIALNLHRSRLRADHKVHHSHRLWVKTCMSSTRGLQLTTSQTGSRFAEIDVRSITNGYIPEAP